MAVDNVRSVVAHPIFLSSSEQVERGDASPGDTIFVFHSVLSAAGDVDDLGISGGGTWGQLAERSGGSEWDGTVIWQKTIGSSEPTTYTVTQQDEEGFGVVILLVLKGVNPTGIVVQSADGHTAPAATPGNPIGVEIRYGAGAPDNEPVSWAQLDGYDGLDFQVLDSLTTAAIAVRPYLSSAAVPARNLAPNPSGFPGHAFTILVKAAGSGGTTPPTPPTFPASTPGRGEARLRYTVHDYLTGSYLADVYPSGVTLSKMFSDAGAWNGRLDMSNPAESEKINAIFPADQTVLVPGPGSLVMHTWRSGVLWGIHWLHTTETGRDERGNVYMQVRGSTLDGYLNYVAVEEDLLYFDDQIQNARDLISHMQATPGSNPGLGLMAGVSGVTRLLEVKATANARYGRVLQDYAKAVDGFEFVVNPRVIDGAIVRSWEWGSPRIVGAGEHVFVEAVGGGTITSWREVRSALSGGTRWGAIGGTPEQEDATLTAVAVRAALVSTPHIAAGAPIVDQRPNHPGQSIDQAVVDDYAAFEAARAAGAPSVFSFDAILGARASLGPNSLGDQVRVILNNPRYPIKADGSASFNRSQRLIGWELTPADRTAGGKDRIRLTTQAEVAEG